MTDEKKRWKEKTAIVTGSASGIGKAITKALVNIGVNVYGLDIQYDRIGNPKEEKRVKGQGIFTPMKCDISNVTDVTAAFDEIYKKNGIHILVNCAGIVNYKRIIESNSEDFKKILDINVLGMSMCTQTAVQYMLREKVECHIFNINSLLGHEVPQQPLSDLEGCNGWNLYPASKHATVALTRTVQRELEAISAPIRITSISPGLVKTNICSHAPEIFDIFETQPHLDPRDIADAIIFALERPPHVQISEMIIESTRRREGDDQSVLSPINSPSSSMMS